MTFGCCRREESYDKDENEGSKHQGVTAFSLGAALEVDFKEPSGRTTTEGVLGAEILMLPTMTLMLRKHVTAVEKTSSGRRRE